MQYDSLGYLVCWSLLYSGQYSFAVYLLDNTLKFFNINYKEVRFPLARTLLRERAAHFSASSYRVPYFQAADQLTHAYKYGSFEKVIEFLNFRERLKNSFHYSLVTIEHLINDLIHLPSHETTMQVSTLVLCQSIFFFPRPLCEYILFAIHSQLSSCQ